MTTYFRRNKKILKRILSIIIVAIAGLVFAQDALAPEFKNTPMLLKNGALVKLEKQTAEQKTKAKGMGYGGVSSFILLVGEKSPIRTSNKPVFYLKVDADIDPETVFYLSKVTKANSKGREVEMSRMSAFAAYGAKGKSTKADDVVCTYTKVSEGVYSLTPNNILAPGEYVFINVSQGSGQGASGSMLYAFGVD